MSLDSTELNNTNKININETNKNKRRNKKKVSRIFYEMGIAKVRV